MFDTNKKINDQNDHAWINGHGQFEHLNELALYRRHIVD